MKKTMCLLMRRGEIDEETEKIELDDGSVLECLLNEELYTFLGIPENESHNVEDIVKSLLTMIKQRTNVTWSSPLSDHNKVTSTNVWVHACVEYFMWTEKINLTDLRQMDRTIREILNKQKAKYKLQLNEALYLPRNKGGRGLKQFERTYKILRIKSALNVITEDEPRMTMVRRFDEIQRQKNRSSLIKDAIKFAQEDFDAQLEVQDNTFTFSFKKDDTTEVTTNKAAVSRYLKSKSVDNALEKIMNATWQGVIMKQRYGDEELQMNECFSWLHRWKDCPVEVINDLHSIQLQTVPTLAFLKHRGSAEIIDTSCRLCHGGVESVKHLLSNCGQFAKTLYIRRHNRVLRYILFKFLYKFKLIETCHPWYSEVDIKPSYENEDILLLWDIPEYSGRDDENDDHVLRPDGKLVWKKKKEIYVLEMSIPWIENREVKLGDKLEKYENIIRSIKCENPECKVDQVTFIVDCLGGFSKSLIDNLRKLSFDATECKHIVLGIQKIVMSEARSLINCFKMSTCT
jgi:hypothetical protein